MAKPIPVTRAKTVDGLLAHIERIITEEPKRLDMGVVCVRGAESLKFYATEQGGKSYLPRKVKIPDCGTVGCIAGWGLVLTGQVGADELNLGSVDVARRTMGLTGEQEVELFYPSKLVERAAKKQTVAHARATVKHIRAFRAKYAAQLRKTQWKRVVDSIAEPQEF